MSSVASTAEDPLRKARQLGASVRSSPDRAGRPGRRGAAGEDGGLSSISALDFFPAFLFVCMSQSPAGAQIDFGDAFLDPYRTEDSVMS